MKSRTFALLLAVGIAASTMMANTALAGPATDMVQARQAELFAKIRADDNAGVLALLDEMIDYGAIAKASLGDQWDARTDAERKEFSSILSQLVQQAYRKNLKKIVDHDVEYVNESTAGDVTTVITKAKSKGDVHEDPIEIGFSLKASGSSYKVVDITTEGVSLVGTYRSQFTKVIKKDGFAVLIQKMKDKLAAG